ncbi:MAG: DNA alkylation repair protein [Prevotella sp.]|nr:DNA alkylation repair protein [Prevotella sp.]
MDTCEKVKQIKRSFRLEMNGITSRSMREKGVGYHLNWGVPYVRLKEMAKPYGEDADLALALWREDIRECKIMAALIMPPSRMTASLASEWMAQVRTQEMAEMLAFNLIQHIPDARQLAFGWIGTSEPLRQIAGLHMLTRLLRKGEICEQACRERLSRRCEELLGEGSLGVRHAAMNTLFAFDEW